MKTIEEITNILTRRLSNVYCDTCGAGEDRCDYCHRKSMLWELSVSSAREIAEEIVGE